MYGRVGAAPVINSKENILNVCEQQQKKESEQ
jgi:hypothetical protein